MLEGVLCSRPCTVSSRCSRVKAVAGTGNSPNPLRQAGVGLDLVADTSDVSMLSPANSIEPVPDGGNRSGSSDVEALSEVNLLEAQQGECLFVSTPSAMVWAPRPWRVPPRL